MFGENRGDVVLPIRQDAGRQALYTSASRDERTNEIVIKAVNSSNSAVAALVSTNAANLAHVAQAIVLTSPADENSFVAPRNVYPKREALQLVGSKLYYTFKPNSLTILRLQESKAP
ncbi:MAG: alpha-L-arabinofuranosidase C-terminal domain-containing protein [Rhizomicrobium sp.]